MTALLDSLLAAEPSDLAEARVRLIQAEREVTMLRDLVRILESRFGEAQQAEPEQVDNESPASVNGNGHANGHVASAVNRVGLDSPNGFKRRGRPPNPLKVAPGKLTEAIYDLIAQHGPMTPAVLAKKLDTTERGIRMTVAKSDQFQHHLDGNGRICLRPEA